jgi:UDP-N-acetylglucosamine acyltransferase
MSIHSTAVIEAGAELGEGVEVEPFAWVHSGVTLGDGCRIGPHAILYGGTTLGAGCTVHAGAVLGDTPQDLAFKGGASYVRVGDRCTLREGVTIHRGTVEGTSTVVGDDCYLMAFSHLAHNVELGHRVIMANGSLLGGYVEVGEGCFIGGNAVVHQFCRVGRLAMLGGASGASQDVPPFCTIASVERNHLAGLNSVGLRRAGFTPAERSALKKAYANLFGSTGNLSAAVSETRAQFPGGPVAELCDFVETSKRGVCRPH